MEGTDLGAVLAQWLSRVRGRSWKRPPFLLSSSSPSLMLREEESQCLGLWPSTEDAMVSG